MRKKIAIVLCLMITLAMNLSAIAAEKGNSSTHNEMVLQEYSLDESDVVFTMDLFNEVYTRDDVADILKVEKAKSLPATKEYTEITVSEEEIDKVYDKMEALAARAPAINYYFSRVYWRYRFSADYNQDIITLTLVPTEVTKKNKDLEITMASWALVKAECGNSQYWTNERSLEQQFRCHALGEIYYPGDVGDWDLEPIRPYVGLIEFAINKCNPV